MNHNPMSIRSIESLPPEVLSLVFELGGASEDDDKEPQYWKPDGDGFHRLGKEAPTILFGDFRPLSFRSTVSSVCHFWYLVALSTSSLWTTLGFAAWDSLDRLHTLLERSRDLPLDVRINDYIEVDLESPCDFGCSRPQFEQEYVTLFRSLAPRFRSLRLDDSRINWTDPWVLSLSNLTTLELVKSEGSDVQPSWNQLLSLLRSAPRLKKIVLWDVGPVGSDVPHHDWDTQSTTGDDTRALVSLPYLTDIVIIEEECVQGLLCMLYMPILKNLSLGLFSEQNPPILELLARPVSLPDKTAAIKGQYTPFNQIEHLRMVSPSFIEITPSIRILYDGLHNIKLLQILVSLSYTSPRSSQFLELLAPHTPLSGQAYHEVAVRLPRLETLIICRDRIRKSEAEYISLIHEIVSERKEAGFPLKSLFVQTPGHEEGERLREHVETLTFFL